MLFQLICTNIFAFVFDPLYVMGEQNAWSQWGEMLLMIDDNTVIQDKNQRNDKYSWYNYHENQRSAS